MPRYNPDKVTRLISEMRKAVERLHALARLDEREFLADPDKLGSAKYHFVVSIESAIDLCNHIIAQNGFRAPEDYADAFQVISEQGVFDDSFTATLRDMAKFRNRLVHLYWEVDDRQVHLILKTHLGDFKTFLDGIARFLGL